MLVEIRLSGSNNRWQYQQPVIRIGRDASCDVHLPTTEFPSVSRVHAVLEMVDGVLQLTDPGSANGILVNGERLTAHTVVSGDRIRLGVNGPELEITLVQVAVTPSVRPPAAADEQWAGSQRTRVFEAAAPAPPAPEATSIRSISELMPAAARQSDARASDATRIFSAGLEVTEPPVQHGNTGSGRVRIGVTPIAATPEAEMSAARSPVDSQPTSQRSTTLKGDSAVPAQGLGLVQKLLYVNILLTAILLLVVFQQNQQIQSLKKSQEDAIQNFAPEIAQGKRDFQASKDDMKKQLADSEVSMRNTMHDEENHIRETLQHDIPPLIEKTISENITKYTGVKH
jgi:hypothetical protein